MKKVLFIVLIGVLFNYNVCDVSATPGQLRKSSIVTCNGKTYGSHSNEYGTHWHEAEKKGDRYYATGDEISNNPCENVQNDSNANNDNTNNGVQDNTQSSSSNENVQNAPSTDNSVSSNGTQDNNQNSNSNNNVDDSVGEDNKSDDTSLKSLQVNDDFIKISENMTYETIEDKVNIIVIPNDNKAIVNYEETMNLVVGDNVVNIVVIAENGDELEYKLNIIRNEEVDELSDNTNIVIKVDDEEVKFNSYISDVINITNGVDSLNITYELEDENSSVEIIGNEDLKVGENEITVKVTAENGDVQEYKIIVDKNSKTEDVIYTIIALGIMAGAIYGAVVLIRKFRKK
jgi:hypothetical protein